MLKPAGKLSKKLPPALTPTFSNSFNCMRTDIVHPRAGELSYEIRGIVDFAQKLAATGIDITWENIGDPVAKGELVPDWIRKIVTAAVADNMASYAYSPTKGLKPTRDYLAKKRSEE